MTGLKPCECGNQAEMHWSRDGEASWAKCDACGREGPVRLTETKAITAWNKLPSERITGDKGRENPAEGAPPASGAPQDDLVQSIWDTISLAQVGKQLLGDVVSAGNDKINLCNIIAARLAPIITERDAALAKLAAAEAREGALLAALDPDKTKAAYIGEFYWTEDEMDEGAIFQRKLTVPWPTIKTNMAAIKARAALATEKHTLIISEGIAASKEGEK